MRTDLGVMPLTALLGLGLACGSTSDGEAAAPDARAEASAGSPGIEGGSGGSTGGSSGSASGGMGGTAAGSTGGTAGSSDRDGSAAGGVPTTADAAASLDAFVPPEDATFRLDANVGGCVPLPDSTFCSGDRPVTWYCENFPVPEEFLSGPCMDAGTALIRYCCPCSFQDVCR